MPYPPVPFTPCSARGHREGAQREGARGIWADKRPGSKRSPAVHMALARRTAGALLLLIHMAPLLVHAGLGTPEPAGSHTHPHLQPPPRTLLPAKSRVRPPARPPVRWGCLCPREPLSPYGNLVWAWGPFLVQTEIPPHQRRKLGKWKELPPSDSGQPRCAGDAPAGPRSPLQDKVLPGGLGPHLPSSGFFCWVTLGEEAAISSCTLRCLPAQCQRLGCRSEWIWQQLPVITR